MVQAPSSRITNAMSFEDQCTYRFHPVSVSAAKIDLSSIFDFSA